MRLLTWIADFASYSSFCISTTCKISSCRLTLAIRSVTCLGVSVAMLTCLSLSCWFDMKEQVRECRVFCRKPKQFWCSKWRKYSLKNRRSGSDFKRASQHVTLICQHKFMLKRNEQELPWKCVLNSYIMSSWFRATDPYDMSDMITFFSISQ